MKQYLASNQISQAQFAKLLDVKQPTVSDYVNGHIVPKAAKLRQISEITGLSIDKLLANKARKS